MWHKGAAWPGCASVLIWNTCCLQCCVHSALRLWPYRFVLRPERQPETFIPWGYGHWPLATGHSQIHTPTRCSYMDSYMAFGMPGARCSMLLLDSFFFLVFWPSLPGCVFKRFVVALGLGGCRWLCCCSLFRLLLIWVLIVVSGMGSSLGAVGFD